MIDLESLRKIVNSELHLSAKEIELIRLPGDASNRSYYRLGWKENGSLQALILMVLAEPEGFKASEEAVSGAPSQINELPFINVQRHLQACKAAVPEILHYDMKRGWLFLEDLGDITFASEIEGHLQDEAVVARYYKKAIDALLTLHLEATAVPSIPSLAHQRAFDHSLFMWEFDHFIEYGIEKRERITLPEKEKTAIRAHFGDIALRLASLPRVFTHRDYHSRNLMVQHEPDHRPDLNRFHFRIRIIDFQDALIDRKSVV